MASRLKLQTKLEELPDIRKVYYDPPEGVKMEYDAIRYSKRKPKTNFANDSRYFNMNCFELIVISRMPDHPAVEEILGWPYSSFERHYISDNLHHDVITLYL